jgi:hypothetical protein
LITNLVEVSISGQSELIFSIQIIKKQRKCQGRTQSEGGAFLFFFDLDIMSHPQRAALQRRESKGSWFDSSAKAGSLSLTLYSKRAATH